MSDIVALCDKLFVELDSESSKLLDTSNLIPIIQKVLENERAIKYLCDDENSSDTKCKIFKYLHNKLIIKNKKNFIHLNKIEDFSLSFLFHLYH
jgi:hypothetical protein